MMETPDATGTANDAPSSLSGDASVAKHTPGPRVTVQRINNLMFFDHVQAGIFTHITVKIGGLRPRYQATRAFPHGKPLKMSAIWARVFLSDCLRPMCNGYAQPVAGGVS